MSEKVALAWALLLVVGLLMGLVIVAVALGVARHLRRQRNAVRRRQQRRAGADPEDDMDLPGGTRHARADEDDSDT